MTMQPWDHGEWWMLPVAGVPYMSDTDRRAVESGPFDEDHVTGRRSGNRTGLAELAVTVRSAARVSVSPTLKAMAAVGMSSAVGYRRCRRRWGASLTGSTGDRHRGRSRLRPADDVVDQRVF